MPEFLWGAWQRGVVPAQAAPIFDSGSLPAQSMMPPSPPNTPGPTTNARHLPFPTLEMWGSPTHLHNGSPTAVWAVSISGLLLLRLRDSQLLQPRALCTPGPRRQQRGGGAELLRNPQEFSGMGVRGSCRVILPTKLGGDKAPPTTPRGPTPMRLPAPLGLYTPRSLGGFARAPWRKPRYPGDFTSSPGS